MKRNSTLTQSPLTLTRIEPLSWWTGMKTPLQLLLHGKDLTGASLRVTDGKGVTVTKVHNADSPNYVFADVEIAPDAAPGEYTFEITKGDRSTTFSYTIDERRRSSADRNSFTSADTVYLLMPDRFANADPDIDSTPDTVEKANRKAPFGRHGGDLKGIMQHLDYIADLGITTLWITPPQLDNEKEESYHGYACADYYHIDPRLGDNETYRQLVEEAHNKGLKMIMDAVPNHCGTAHWWMEDLPFDNWINKHSHLMLSSYRLATISDPNSSEDDVRQTVDGWFDRSMSDIGLRNPYVLQYFIQMYIWWIEWANLDGLRVDTFPYNDKNSIAKWTRCILDEYPNLNIVGECWHSSPAVVAYWQTDTPNGDGYNSHLLTVMDFPLQEALDDSLSKDSTEWSEGMNRLYEAVALDFLYTDTNRLLIFLDNHDTERFTDIVRGNPERIKLGITLLATMRGIPQLYYGTEQAFRSTDLASAHGGSRRDFPGGWAGDRKNLFTGKGRNKREADIYQHTRRLFNWRKTATAIHHGKTMHYLPQGNTYSFFRYTANESVFVFINASDKTVTVPWNRYHQRTEGFTAGTNIITGRKVKIGGRLTVEPRTAIVLELF